MNPRGRVSVMFVIAGIAAAALAVTPAKGDRCSGAMTCNGKKVELRHAFAFIGVGFDGKTEQVLVVLTDQPVAPADARDTYRLSQLADASKVHALILRVDPTSKALKNAELLSKNLSRFCQTSGEGPKLEVSQMDGTSIAGKTFSSQELDTGADKFAWEATFEAAVNPKQP